MSRSTASTVVGWAVGEAVGAGGEGVGSGPGLEYIPRGVGVGYLVPVVPSGAAGVGLAEGAGVGESALG